MSRKRTAISPSAAVFLMVIIAAVLLAATWVNNRPISGPTGESFTITMHSIREGIEMHRIDAGLEHDFRIWRGDKADRLLQPKMQGRSFRVLAEERRPSKSDPYYRIIEIVAEDGSFAYTWEDYAAGQAARLPGRMIGMTAICAAFIGFAWWSLRGTRRR